MSRRPEPGGPMTLESAMRRLRRRARRMGADTEPIPLPELDGFDPPMALPGDTLPERCPQPWGGLGMGLPYYDPGGALLRGDFEDVYRQYEAARRRPGSHLVATFYRAGTRLRISTVYLGLDHGWGMGPPFIWETMVFHGGGPGQCGNGNECWRYATRAAARSGHFGIVTAIRQEQLARRERFRRWPTIAPVRVGPAWA